MTERTCTLRKTPKFGRVLALLAAWQLAAMLSAAAATWENPTDAITNLWNGRLTANRAWPVASCDNYAALSAPVQAITTNTESGLVVPQLSVNSVRLTDNVAAMARALLNTDLNATAAGAFLPVDPNKNGPIDMNLQFWAANLRSSHADNLHRLPATHSNLPDPPQHCPGGLAANNREQTLKALNQTVNANLTNRVKWHCYANRFRMVGDVDNGIPGFVEITHFEFLGAASQYPYAAAQGRFVFDYFNKRVYYTPAHYRVWSKASFDPVPDDPAPAAKSTCNPFFEIVL